MNPENNRRDTRVPARVGVVILRGKTAASHETRDVSYRGLFVCTKAPPPLRSLVRLRVSLPGHSFEAHAMVVHIVEDLTEGSGVGLQFWGLSGPDRRAWDEFVRPLVQAATQVVGRTNMLTIKTPHPAGTEPVSGVRVVARIPGTGSGD